MKRLLLIVNFIITSFVINGACPPPMIQAVCEITKIDGSVIQGYIILATYDCNGFYINGFLSYNDSNHYKTDFFSMGLKSIEFGEAIMFYQFDGHNGGFGRQKNLKYIIGIADPSYSDTHKQKLKTELGQVIYTISASLQRKYIVKDSIRIYHELDENACVPTSGDYSNYTDVDLKDIVKITFLAKAKIPNLSELTQLGIDAENRAWNGPEENEDFQLPLWYHDIINDPIRTKEINKSIEEWTIRY